MEVPDLRYGSRFVWLPGQNAKVVNRSFLGRSRDRGTTRYRPTSPKGDIGFSGKLLARERKRLEGDLLSEVAVGWVVNPPFDVAMLRVSEMRRHPEEERTPFHALLIETRKDNGITIRAIPSVIVDTDIAGSRSDVGSVRFHELELKPN